MPNEYLATNQEFTKTADAIRRKSGSPATIEWKSGKGFADAVDGIWNATVYGFHINSNESDPSAAVTYLAGAIGATPAHMDYDNGVFDYGSWKDAFFMPRPCMLKYDGTVDYYLDPNDYAKKEDGTPSDVADDTYGGNAMMEWGQNGKKIWYKIVPDANDDTSASIYIADHQADEGFHAWSFINNQGVMVDHFYTHIYEGWFDGNGKLRSLSGKTLQISNMTPSEEVQRAELNNPSTEKLWYIDPFSDVLLIQILLILMGKTRKCEIAFGAGRHGQQSYIDSGTMDDKGLFYGNNDGENGVKVFGIENFYGNLQQHFAGLVSVGYEYKYKLTKGTQDGSTSNDYTFSGTSRDYNGYLSAGPGPESTSLNYVKSMKFIGSIFLPKEIGVTLGTYWATGYYMRDAVRFVSLGSRATTNANCSPFFLNFYNAPTINGIASTALSCKPLAQSE